MFKKIKTVHVWWYFSGQTTWIWTSTTSRSCQASGWTTMPTMCLNWMTLTSVTFLWKQLWISATTPVWPATWTATLVIWTVPHKRTFSMYSADEDKNAFIRKHLCHMKRYISKWYLHVGVTCIYVGYRSPGDKQVVNVHAFSMSVFLPSFIFKLCNMYMCIHKYMFVLVNINFKVISFKLKNIMGNV